MVFPAEPCGIVSMFGWADIAKSGVIVADVTLARLPIGAAKTNPVNSMKRKNNFIGILKNYTYGTVQLRVAFFAGLNVSVVSVYPIGFRDPWDLTGSSDFCMVPSLSMMFESFRGYRSRFRSH